MLRCCTLALALFALCTTVSRAQNWDDRRGSFFSVGLHAGLGPVVDAGGMEYRGFGASISDDPGVSLLVIDETGSGEVFLGGIDVTYEIDSRLRLTSSIDLESRSARYRSNVPFGRSMTVGGVNEAVESESELRMDVEMQTIGGTFDLGYFPFETDRFDIGLTTGIRLRTLIASSEERAIVERKGGDSEGSTIDLFSGAIDDATSPQFGLRFGILGEYSLDYFGTGIVQIGLHYDHPLTDLVPDSDWNSRTVSLSLGFVLRLVPDRLTYADIPACSGPEPEFGCPPY